MGNRDAHSATHDITCSVAESFERLINDPSKVDREVGIFTKKETPENKFVDILVNLTPSNSGCYNHDELKSMVADFLWGLRDKSYFNRYSKPKPGSKELLPVEHFIGFDEERYHASFAVVFDDKIIAAASILESKRNDFNEIRAAEVSVAIADECQRMGLGRELIERPRDHAIEQGFDHIVAD